MGIGVLLAVGAAVRFALIAYGEWQDKVLNLKYTDIDYSVFSDAAVHVSQGKSPYDRDTYRYTPILAYLLLPNVYIHPCFGKVLFSIADILLGYMLYRILVLRKVASSTAVWCTATWVLNPLPVVVSSRGNAESVLACMVVGTILLLMLKHNLLAAILFAVAVHFKTYPIIYAPSVYLLINEHYSNNLNGAKTKLRYVASLLWPSDIALVFAVVGVTVLGGLGFLFYNMYGDKFIDETYLYHVTRKDTQHNFSIYFLPLRIAEDLDTIFSMMIGLSAFIPQLGATIAFSYKYYRDLPFCWFILTLAFVTFNKVCTSQYFLWYLCFLPLVAPSLKFTKWEAGKIFILWLTALVIWFIPAYYYEYHKYNILGVVWMGSLYFFWVNIWCMWKFLKAYNYSPILNLTGEIRQQTVVWGHVTDKTKKK